MKTGKELILELPNGVRRNFILNTIEQKGNKEAERLLSSNHRSIPALIYAGFIWVKTTQGIDYWCNLVEKYE